MGEAVMRGVEAPEPLRRHQHQEPRDPRHHPVDPLGPEGGPVAALVQRGEQEDDQDAVRHQQQRPERHAQRDGSAQSEDGGEMGGELRADHAHPSAAAARSRSSRPEGRDQGAMVDGHPFGLHSELPPFP